MQIDQHNENRIISKFIVYRHFQPNMIQMELKCWKNGKKSLLNGWDVDHLMMWIRHRLVINHWMSSKLVPIFHTLSSWTASMIAIDCDDQISAGIKNGIIFCLVISNSSGHISPLQRQWSVYKMDTVWQFYGFSSRHSVGVQHLSHHLCTPLCPHKKHSLN